MRATLYQKRVRVALRLSGFLMVVVALFSSLFVLVETNILATDLGGGDEAIRLVDDVAPEYPPKLAIYREATANDTITTANFDHDWDNQVKENGDIFSQSGANITLKRVGHYLVLYGARFDSPSGNRRSEIQTQLRLAGADLPIGWSQGYMRRNNGNFELFTSGGGIINVATADEVLVLRSFRTDSYSGSVTRTPNTSGIQLLRLNNDWDYARLKRTTTQTGPTSSTYVAVQYDAQDELDTGSFSHSTSVNPEDITLETAGHYLVIANTYGSLGSGVNDRTLVNQKLTLGGLDIDGTLTSLYIRGNQNGHSTQEGAASTGVIIETTSAGQILNVEVNRSDGTQAWTINQDDTGTTVERTAVTIVKLPDTADYIRLDDSLTDNINPTALTPMGWDDEDEKDTDSFTHTGGANDSRIEVNIDGEYLFFATLYSSPAAVVRGYYSQGWTKTGGALIQYGQTGNYNRASGANDTGNWSGFIAHDLVAGDYVEVEVQELAASGTMDADVKGVQGVRIRSLPTESPS